MRGCLMPVALLIAFAGSAGIALVSPAGLAHGEFAEKAEPRTDSNALETERGPGVGAEASFGWGKRRQAAALQRGSGAAAEFAANAAGADAEAAWENGAAQMPSAASVVSTRTYVSLEPVPQAGDFQVAVVVKILDGYHMNSHKPSDAYLIPTTITPQLPAGFELEDTMYPSGEQKTFAFSPSKALDVYTGTVTLRMRIAAKAEAAMGATAIPITLRYQACNNTTCLPPVRVPVTARFEVAAAGTTPREMHPEIFRELKKLR